MRAVEEIVALGVDDAGPARRRQGRKQPVAPSLRDLADRLSDALETRVKVELGQRKGKITVEFASLDDLDRIVKTISPDRSRRRPPRPPSRAEPTGPHASTGHGPWFHVKRAARRPAPDAAGMRHDARIAGHELVHVRFGVVSKAVIQRTTDSCSSQM